MSNTATISMCDVRGKAMWRVNIPRSVAGKQVRKFFPEDAKVSAELWAAQHVEMLRKHGTRGVEIADGLSVAQAVARFCGTREREKEHSRLIGFYLDKFSAKFGSLPIRSIAALDLEEFWTRKTWGANTRRQAFAYLRMFLNWCERYDIIDKNPSRRVDPPKAEKPDRAILTVDQMKTLLCATTGPMRVWLCLGGFAGLRTSEILSGKVRVDGEEIHVEDGKTGGRYVARLPVFGRYWPGQYVAMDERTFRRHRQKLVETVKLREWPDNCLRHSFASYHLAMWEDAGKTAYQLGHTSPQMVYKAYARAVKKQDSVDWWGMATS